MPVSPNPGPSTATVPTTWPGFSSLRPGSPTLGGEVNGLARVAVQFLNDAQSYAGPCRNRMDSNGRWGDEPSRRTAGGAASGDWELPRRTVTSSLVRRVAVIQFERAAKMRSPWPRAMAFAALGAAELLAVDPEQRGRTQTAHRLRQDRGSAERRRGLAMA